MPSHPSHLIEAAFANLTEALQSEDSSGHFTLASLATMARDQTPAARTIVIRDFDREAKTLQFYTDVRSQKTTHLANNPAATLLLYDPQDKLQLRLITHCAIFNRTPETQRVWNSLNEHQKRDYRSPATPGEPILSPASATPPSNPDPTFGYEKFTIIEAQIQTADALKIQHPTHLRAVIDYQSPAPEAQWMAP